MIEKVLVLMSTYNGEKYLDVQLDSILNQEGVEVHLLVRDDGSKDGTISILRDYASRYENIIVLEESNCGAIWSFYKLMEYAVKHYSNFKLFAFSDQDDYWQPDKLARAIGMNVGNSDNYFYHSCYSIVDEDLNLIRKSVNTMTLGTLGEAIIANHSIGCSEVFTYKVLSEASKICGYQLDNPKFYPYHDLWVYLVALATKADVVFDDYCSLKYRQHSHNVIGIRKSKLATLKFQYDHLMKTKHEKSGFAGILLDLLELDKGTRDLLECVRGYRDSFGNRLRLAADKRFKTKSRFHNNSFKYCVLMGIF